MKSTVQQGLMRAEESTKLQDKTAELAKSFRWWQCPKWERIRAVSTSKVTDLKLLNPIHNARIATSFPRRSLCHHSRTWRVQKSQSALWCSFRARGGMGWLPYMLILEGVLYSSYLPTLCLLLPPLCHSRCPFRHLQSYSHLTVDYQQLTKCA